MTTFKVGDKVRHIVDIRADGTIRFDDPGEITALTSSKIHGFDGMAYVRFSTKPDVDQACLTSSLISIEPTEPFEGELEFTV